MIKEIAISVQRFFKNPLRMMQCHTLWTPLHITAEQGRLELCRYVIERTEKSSSNYDIATPLHFAAEHGHIEVCRLLLLNDFDNNPRLL